LDLDADQSAMKSASSIRLWRANNCQKQQRAVILFTLCLIGTYHVVQMVWLCVV